MLGTKGLLCLATFQVLLYQRKHFFRRASRLAHASWALILGSCDNFLTSPLPRQDVVYRTVTITVHQQEFLTAANLVAWQSAPLLAARAQIEIAHLDPVVMRWPEAYFS